MSDAAVAILSDLTVVERERSRRRADISFGARVTAIKAFQQARFRTTYADLLASPRYERAAEFFLDELYGPVDFSQRDAQFARVVPTLVRLFPSDVVDVVRTLAQLHALSEVLDSDMASHISVGGAIDARTYVKAWVATGRATDRVRQVQLMVRTAVALDSLTRRALVRNSLRLMRAPARAAGLGELQTFLESGFDAFRGMGGAAEFIGTVEARESALAKALFDGDDSRLAHSTTADASLRATPR